MESESRRVLVLDDGPVERAAFARFARSAGWVVAGEAADAADALEALDESNAELVVLDGRLPPDGALNLLPRLLEARPGLLVLIVVALDEAPLLREALKLGAAGALQRPLLPAQVIEQLRRVARTPPARRE